jgi:dihydrofolate reductase/thymidylate synthase
MFSLICAHESNLGIGHKGKLPWKENKQELNLFKKITTEGDHKNFVIMGRKTWDSIPVTRRPLKDRTNIVITSNITNVVDFNNDTMEMDPIAMTFDECIRYFESNKKTFKNSKKFVIGGSMIYKEFLNRGLVYEMHISHMDNYYKSDSYITYNSDNWINQPEYSKKYRGFTYKRYCFNNKEEYALLNTMNTILSTGHAKENRTGINTIGLFSPNQLRFDLSTGKLPAITTRSLPLSQVFEELMWFLRGQTDSKILEKKKVYIWKPNSSETFLRKRKLTYEVGDVGPTYGFQMRHFGADYINCNTNYDGKGVDQLYDVIYKLKHDPTNRRIMINLWNSGALDKMALPPCGFNYQFYVHDSKLSCKVTQRSSDIALAGGWNICSASLLTIMLAHICGLKTGEVIWSPGDTHIYTNQLQQVAEQLDRLPKPFPSIKIVKTPKCIENFEWNYFKVEGYEPYNKLAFAMNA